MTGTVEPFHDPDRPPSPGASASAGQGTATTSDYEARVRDAAADPRGSVRHTAIDWRSGDRVYHHRSGGRDCPWCGYAAPNPYDAGLTDDE